MVPDFHDIDLVPFHFMLSVAGVTLCLWVMQLSGNNRIAKGEAPCLRVTRRVGIALVATGMLFSVRYSFIQGWQPWPPTIILYLGIDMALLATVISAHRRMQKERIGQCQG